MAVEPGGDADVAGVVEIDLALDEFTARIVADGDEHARDVEGGRLARNGVTDLQSGDAVLAQDFEGFGVDEESDLLVRLGALEHDARGPELFAAVHEGNAAGEAGEEGCFFHGGVTAADHDDVLVAEEETVAGGAGADAAAEEAFFTGNAR